VKSYVIQEGNTPHMTRNSMVLFGA